MHIISLFGSIDLRDFHSHFKVHLLVHNLVMTIKPQSLFIYEVYEAKVNVMKDTQTVLFT